MRDDVGDADIRFVVASTVNPSSPKCLPQLVSNKPAPTLLAAAKPLGN
jgi:hypothetical protein